MRLLLKKILMKHLWIFILIKKSAIFEEQKKTPVSICMIKANGGINPTRNSDKFWILFLINTLEKKIKKW